MAEPVMNARSLKAQAKGREKAMKLRAAAAKMKFKLTKLEHQASAMRRKIKEYEDKAQRFEEGIAPPKAAKGAQRPVPRPASREPPPPSD